MSKETKLLKETENVRNLLWDAFRRYEPIEWRSETKTLPEKEGTPIAKVKFYLKQSKAICRLIEDEIKRQGAKARK